MIFVNGKKIDFMKFPNGETNFNHHQVLDIISNYNRITFMYEDDSDLIKLLLLKKYIDNTRSAFSRTIRLYLSYMPYSRADRSEDNSPFALKYIAEFINSLEFDRVDVIEPHSDVTMALLKNAQFELATEMLLDFVMVDMDFDLKNDSIVFPDLGASRRYKNMKAENIIIGHKNRDFTTGKILNLELIGNKKSGSKALIIDDLTSRGGTFVHTSIKLKEVGFEEVYLLVAHAENTVFEGELFDHIDKLYTTDSILTKQNDWANKKFENQIKVYPIENLRGAMRND